MRTVIAEAGNGRQVLVTLWGNGEIEVALRRDNGDLWGRPLAIVNDQDHPEHDPAEIARDRETFVDQLLREARG